MSSQNKNWSKYQCLWNVIFNGELFRFGFCYSERGLLAAKDKVRDDTVSYLSFCLSEEQLIKSEKHKNIRTFEEPGDGLCPTRVKKESMLKHTCTHTHKLALIL